MTKLFSAVLLISLCTVAVAFADVGERPESYRAPLKLSNLLSSQAAGGLTPVVTETGQISWSIDAAGSVFASNTIQVEKPAGATVRAAYLMAASTGFTGYQFGDADITLAGTPVSWDQIIPSDIGSYNGFTDVTAIVKPIIDGAPAGVTDLAVSELFPSSIDGEILVVIFDDPSQSFNTIVLAFGAQKVGGDTFNIGLAEPIDKSAPGFGLDMSLGISYSYQQFSSQFSTVDINGNRLTSSAGGNDDGDYVNGALITAGGIGDSDANPADPNHTPSGADTFYDDELYDLTSFVSDGDTSISAVTSNPSTDDNIFFAGFFFGATTAVVGEGIVLSPQSATNPLYTDHTVTATVQDDNGQPLSGVAVTFEIVSGPNAGQTLTVDTDAFGKAQFTWSSDAEGTDEVVARFYNQQQVLTESNHVTKTWENPVDVPEFGLLGGLVLLAAAIGVVATRRS